MMFNAMLVIQQCALSLKNPKNLFGGLYLLDIFGQMSITNAITYVVCGSCAKSWWKWDRLPPSARKLYCRFWCQ